MNEVLIVTGRRSITSEKSCFNAGPDSVIVILAVDETEDERKGYYLGSPIMLISKMSRGGLEPPTR